MFFMLVFPYMQWEAGSYETMNDCLSQGEMQYLQMAGPNPVDTIDWYCYGDNGDVSGPQR